MRPSIQSAKEFLAKNSAHGKSDTTCTYIAVLLDEIERMQTEVANLRRELADEKAVSDAMSG